MMQIVMLIKIIREHLTSQRGSSIDSLMTMMTKMMQIVKMVKMLQKNVCDLTQWCSSFTIDTNLDGCDDTNDTNFEDHQKDANCDQNNAKKAEPHNGDPGQLLYIYQP